MVLDRAIARRRHDALHVGAWRDIVETEGAILAVGRRDQLTARVPQIDLHIVEAGAAARGTASEMGYGDEPLVERGDAAVLDRDAYHDKVAIGIERALIGKIASGGVERELIGPVSDAGETVMAAGIGDRAGDDTGAGRVQELDREIGETAVTRILRFVSVLVGKDHACDLTFTRICHGDRDGLGDAQIAIGGLHGDVVHIVRMRRRLVVRRGLEAHRARGRINREKAVVGGARERVS